MRILLVDDDERKRDRVTEVVNDVVGSRNADITVASSTVEAARALEGWQFDLLILDINLPMRLGEPPNKDAGIRLLKQLLRDGPRFQRPVHILGLTAYDELIGSFGSEFSLEAWQLIKYDASTTVWSETLQRKLLHVYQTTRSLTVGHYIYDLAIVTALKAVELEAVLRLDASWVDLDEPGDPTRYYAGTLLHDGKSARVIAAAASEMGMAATASLATKIIIKFKPKVLAMAGIAAGIGLEFGDIVVADQSWDYGSGKVNSDPDNPYDSIFAPAPNYIPIDSDLKERIGTFVTRRRDVIASIQSRWEGDPATTPLKVAIGPIATGAAVIENERQVAEIRSRNRKVIGVEMETYGLYLAARIAPDPRPKFFSAKSVCDFGKPPKIDRYQRYAAFTSAQFIYEFYCRELMS
jgi:nucleoside phosphorylase/CheY-like chemotaxis protein